MMSKKEAVLDVLRANPTMRSPEVVKEVLRKHKLSVTYNYVYDVRNKMKENGMTTTDETPKAAETAATTDPVREAEDNGAEAKQPDRRADLAASMGKLMRLMEMMTPPPREQPLITQVLELADRCGGLDELAFMVGELQGFQSRWNARHAAKRQG